MLNTGKNNALWYFVLHNTMLNVYLYRNVIITVLEIVKNEYREYTEPNAKRSAGVLYSFHNKKR